MDEQSLLLEEDITDQWSISGGMRVKYDDFSTIDWIHDFAKERIRHHRLQTHGSWIQRLFDASQAWIVVSIIGLCTGAIAAFICVSEEWLFDLRNGYCSTTWYLNSRICCSGEETCKEWVRWNYSYTVYITLGTFFAFLSAFLVRILAPYAAGSGIPEVKTILGGFIMRSFLGIWTLIVKAIGLPLSTASGLSVGKEGPLVHVSCCIGNIFARVFEKISKNEAKKREILSAAAAAGVSCAFGAPIGGVLFSLEEVSYYFPYKTMLRSFFSAMVAAVTLQMLNPLQTGKLVMFQVKYEHIWHSFDIFFFVILGVLGGLFGTLFIRLNLAVVTIRKRTWIQNRPVQEATCVAFITALLSCVNVFLYVGSGNLVHSLFTECVNEKGIGGICSDENIFWTCISLLIAAFLKSVLTVITFGTRVPCGIFVPSMCIGACVGRALGIFVSVLQKSVGGVFFSSCTTTGRCVNPGPYALLGAASFLAGVTRMTVSLVVIMFEITGALDYILPIMITVMVAKFVGDAFSKESIYDGIIRLNGYPYLDSREEYERDTLCEEIMSIPYTLPSNMKLTELESKLKENIFKGFPITRPNNEIVGYVNRAELRHSVFDARVRCFPDESLCVFEYIKSGSKEVNILNLSHWIDHTPVMIPPSFPVVLTIELFKKLGLRYVLVAKDGLLLGLITKKDILRHLGKIMEMPLDLNFRRLIG